MRTDTTIQLRSWAALAAGLFAISADRSANACGGCFHPPAENPTVVTDHRMIFAVSPDRTTLYDQMRYSGAPSSFAWVLPIAGQVTIGLSSDELFNVLDAQTSVQIYGPPSNCWVPPTCIPNLPVSAVASAAAPGGAGVTVIASEVVGPYETVQLRASDPKALATWLSAHHYVIPPESQAIVDEYVNEKSAFLAMKLVPGATVRAMRPVRVTSPGASLSLPLRMVAAGAGATLGVTLWVVADGRYEPQNFPTFTIAPSDVAWDWAKQSSDYATVRAARTAASNGTGWQLESSMDLPTRGIAMQLEYISPSRRPVPPVATTAPPTDSGSRLKTEDELLREDLGVLFGSRDPATVRVTRMRADLAHAALRQDLRLQATAGQAMLSNLVQVTRETGQPSCPVYDESCATVASAPREEATRKNKALSSPHFDNDRFGGGGDGGKKWYACAASPTARSSDPGGVLVVLAALGAAILRRRALRPARP
jgi:hypothetical protein